MTRFASDPARSMPYGYAAVRSGMTSVRMLVEAASESGRVQVEGRPRLPPQRHQHQVQQISHTTTLHPLRALEPSASTARYQTFQDIPPAQECQLEHTCAVGPRRDINRDVAELKVPEICRMLDAAVPNETFELAGGQLQDRRLMADRDTLRKDVTVINVSSIIRIQVPLCGDIAGSVLLSAAVTFSSLTVCTSAVPCPRRPADRRVDKPGNRPSQFAR
eukprot:747421-Hanusia_phi.AAC.2